MFDAEELVGLRIFLREAAEQKPEGQAGGVGNCVACHPAPFFTDFSFHNTGVTQDEYDGVHGGGAFAALVIPSRSERAADPEAFLPPTAKHPDGTGRFRAAADGGQSRAHGPGRLEHPVQLRLPEVAGPAEEGDQARSGDASSPRTRCSTRRSAASRRPACATSATRTRTCTTARATRSRTRVGFYLGSSAQQRAGTLRNGDPALADIDLAPADVAPLAAFLRSLNEDYE